MHKTNKFWKKVGMMLSATLFLMGFGMQYAFAQSAVVSGSVFDQNNAPLQGVTVEAIGSDGKTVATTQTNPEGAFTFSRLPAGKFSFAFTSVSYTRQQVDGFNVKDGTPTNVSINLQPKDGTLGEVVVTALGIVRKKETLGYATQKVDGARLNESPASNFVNNLSGKIAGVNISTTGSVGGSSRIVIRGESSLSITGNQPLYIIDGVPAGNDGSSVGSGNADYGSSSAEINPADIESVNVLKGPAAAALYGSRAFHGAVIITTKKGSSRKGIGVTFNSYYFNEKVARLPKFQNKFGQGNGGLYEGSNFGAGWSGYPNGIQDDYDESWGPRLDNNTLENQFDSPTSNGYRAADVALPNRGDIIATPWVSQPNNIKDFFVSGHKAYNNVAFSGGNESGNYRLSLSALNEKGVIPNNDLKRYNVGLNSSYKLTSKLTSSINLNYVRQESINRPDNGYGRNTFMYFFTWMGRNVNINSLKDYWTSGLKGIRQFQYNYGENHNNPFFMMYENTKGQQKDRLYGNISLDYAILPNLKLKVRTAQDFYNDFRPMKWAVSTVDYENGRYEENRIGSMERNTDLLLTFNSAIPNSDFGYTLTAGANRLDQSGTYQSAAAPSLLVPGIYNLGNSASPLQAGSSKYKKRMNSVYGSANFNYKDLVYLDITGRNDWSSALPINQNSYFYPSVSLNNNIKGILNLESVFSRADVRVSWAQVGRDVGPYSIFNTYGYGAPWGNNYSLVGPGSLLNANLKPEISSAVEVGTSLGFFNNRLGIDFTYYDIRARNQIMPIPNVRSSGAFSRLINAGEIKNSGVEVVLNAVPVSTPNLKWSINLNLSRNIGKVITLTPEVDKIVQSTPGEDASIQARAGERMGAIYGPGYQRVTEGPMKGEIIIFSDGTPRRTSEDMFLGNYNPDWIGGIYNELTYRNFNLNVLFAGQIGGKFISRFYNKAGGAGQLEETARGREARAPGTEYNDPYYVVGAADMGSGKYEPNSTSTDGTYSTGIYGTSMRNFIKRPLDHVSEAQLFSSTYVKLRELSLGYTLPAKLVSRTFIKNARVSLTGRNLLLFTPSSNKHFDPEVSVATQGGGLIPGFENMSTPSTREMGVSLNLNF